MSMMWGGGFEYQGHDPPGGPRGGRVRRTHGGVAGKPDLQHPQPAQTIAFPEVEPSGPTTSASTPHASRALEIITLLPKDAIPAIMNDRVSFLTGTGAAAQMLPSDRIIGLSVGGDHQADSTAQLSSHEVVNDTVGGIPVAVTW